ncbi:MAG TPA: hypothetical protein VK212_03680 [Lentimicrobium sp.]|nr:hypothetical protein [Lentimicrobium sp.]
METVSQTTNVLMNIGFVALYILMIAAILGVIVFPLIQMVGNLKAAKTTIFSIIGLLALFFIAYAVSPAETGEFYQKMGISPNLSKAIGGGLLATYIIFAGVIISIAYSQISSWFK